MKRFKPYKSKNKASTSRDTILTSYASADHAKWLYERNMENHDPEVREVIRRVKSSEDLLAYCKQLGLKPIW